MWEYQGPSGCQSYHNIMNRLYPNYFCPTSLMRKGVLIYFVASARGLFSIHCAKIPMLFLVSNVCVQYWDNIIFLQRKYK